MKSITGDKFIYLCMALQLAKQARAEGKPSAIIGHDSGAKGGQKYWRSFRVTEFEGALYLLERKTTAHSVDFTRTYRVIDGAILPHFELTSDWTH